MILLRHCRRAGIAHIHAQFADSATDVAMLVTHYRRGQRVDGLACSWSLAVHGSVEFYDVTRYALASKLAHARFAVAISDFGRSQLMTLSPIERWPHIHVVRCGVDLRVFAPRQSARARTGVRRSSSSAACSVERGSPCCSRPSRSCAGGGSTWLRPSSATARPARNSKRSCQRRRLSEHVRFLGSVGQDDIRAALCPRRHLLPAELR